MVSPCYSKLCPTRQPASPAPLPKQTLGSAPHVWSLHKQPRSLPSLRELLLPPDRPTGDRVPLPLQLRVQGSYSPDFLVRQTQRLRNPSSLDKHIFVLPPPTPTLNPFIDYNLNQMCTKPPYFLFMYVPCTLGPVLCT